MYNVFLKVTTQLVYTLSGVITPCVRDFNTIIRSCNTSLTMFNHPHVRLQQEEKPQGNPKNMSGMFGDLNDIWHAYVQSMNAKQFRVKYDSVRNINTFPYTLDRNQEFPNTHLLKGILTWASIRSTLNPRSWRFVKNNSPMSRPSSILLVYVEYDLTD